MVHGLRGVAFERCEESPLAARGWRISTPNPHRPQRRGVLSLVDQGGRLAVVFADRVQSNRSSKLSADRLTWKSRRWCASPDDSQPTDPGTSCSCRHRSGDCLGLVDLFGRFGFWLFLGVGDLWFLSFVSCVFWSPVPPLLARVARLLFRTSVAASQCLRCRSRSGQGTVSRVGSYIYNGVGEADGFDSLGMSSDVLRRHRSRGRRAIVASPASSSSVSSCGGRRRCGVSLIGAVTYGCFFMRQ